MVPPTSAKRPALQWEVPEYEVPFSEPCGRRHCVIIPVVNEGARLHRLLERMLSHEIPMMFDVIVVDGGSTDGSVARSALEPLGVHTLVVKTGAGRLSAQLRCAYAHALRAGYEGIITIDGNDKDDPEAIPRFADALDCGADFVQASRFVPGGIADHTPRLRELAIRYVHAPLLSAASGFGWTDTTQGFRAYSRRLLLDPRVAPFRDVFVAYELLAYLSYRAPRLGFRCIELPTARRYPDSGKVPTKISAVRGNLQLMLTLLKTCRGSFNPAEVGPRRESRDPMQPAERD